MEETAVQTQVVVLGPLPTLNFGGLQLPTYNVYISLLLCGLIWYVGRRSFKRDASGATAMDLFLAVLIGGSVGARLLHVLYEEPQYYLANPIEVFYIWQGGFVYYGGVIAGLLSGWIALKIKKQSFPMWLDFFTPVISIGYALGRFACFLAGCCYGKMCAPPLGFPFQQIDVATASQLIVLRHATQLYAMVLELALFALILYWEKIRMFKWPGQLFAAWLGLHALTRFALEFLRDDARGPLIGPLSLSQAISLALFIASALFLSRKRLSPEIK